MRLSDIDLVGRSVYVRRLKNSLSTQHPLFDTELPALTRWLNERRRWRDADSDWLFLSQKGGPLSRHQVRLLLKRYGELGESAFLLTRTCCGTGAVTRWRIWGVIRV